MHFEFHLIVAAREESRNREQKQKNVNLKIRESHGNVLHTQLQCVEDILRYALNRHEIFVL